LGFLAKRSTGSMLRGALVASTVPWLAYGAAITAYALWQAAAAATIIPLARGTQTKVAASEALIRAISRNQQWLSPDHILAVPIAVLFAIIGTSISSMLWRQSHAMNAGRLSLSLEPTRTDWKGVALQLLPPVLTFVASIVGSVLVYLAATARQNLPPQ
jgi:hypothetical protein